MDSESIKAIGSFEIAPKGCSFENQLEEEQVELLLRAHWITNLRWILLVILLCFVPLIVTSIFSRSIPELFALITPKYILTLQVLWYLGLVVFTFEQYILWYFNVYIVTDYRIIDVDFLGLFYKEISEAEIAKIQDTTYRVSGLMRTFFNYGDVMVQTAGEKENIEFLNIPYPADAARTLTNLLKKRT